MPTFPTELATDLRILTGVEFDPRQHSWVADLAASSLALVAGLRRQDVPCIAAIATQKGIREFCPKDREERWGDVEMAERKLAAGKGRGFFQLIDYENDQIAGYGWTGSERCSELPECDTTFAIRLSETYQRRRLATPFTLGIVAATRQLYAAEHIGLETWGSNTGAVRTYLKAGARLVATKDSTRRTLEEGPHVAGGKRQDVRLFMQFADPE